MLKVVINILMYFIKHWVEKDDDSCVYINERTMPSSYKKFFRLRLLTLNIHEVYNAEHILWGV